MLYYIAGVLYTFSTIEAILFPNASEHLIKLIVFDIAGMLLTHANIIISKLYMACL